MNIDSYGGIHIPKLQLGSLNGTPSLNVPVSIMRCMGWKKGQDFDLKMGDGGSLIFTPKRGHNR
jgi:hypothetical protein